MLETISHICFILDFEGRVRERENGKKENEAESSNFILFFCASQIAKEFVRPVFAIVFPERRLEQWSLTKPLKTFFYFSVWL